MAKFNTGHNPTEDVSSNSRPFKVPGQPSHTGLQTRKAALEKFSSQGNASAPSGPSTFHKPVHPKPPLGVKPSTDDKTEKDPKPPYLKPVTQRFGVQLQATNRENDGKAGCTKTPTKTSDLAKEEPKPLYPKPAGNKFLNLAPHEKEKNPLGTKPNSNFAPQESEAKPAFSKVAGVKEKFMSATQENEPKTFSKPTLAQKPSLNHEVSHNEDSSNKNVFLQKGPRPNIHSFKAAKEMDENSKCAAEAAGSHFSNMALKPTGHWSSSSQGNPENVDEKTEEKGMGAAKNIFLNKIIQEESSSSSPKFYKMNTVLTAGRPSGGSQEKEDGDRSSGTPKRKALPPLFKLGQPPQKPSRPPSVDLERFRQSSPKDSEFSLILLSWVLGSSRGKEKKRDKEEKRRMDQEKKEQKEKEKKEQEIRKKFKLTGPVQVLHQARACVDHKGGKYELTVKQGDEIEIIRLRDNPEGKWLGRIKGCYGYIKTTMVEIDYDSLRRKQQTRTPVKHPESEQEVYDDIGDQDSISRNVTFYIVIIACILQRSVSQDEDKNDIWSWGILKRLKVKDDKKKSVREKKTKVNGHGHIPHSINNYVPDFQKLSNKWEYIGLKIFMIISFTLMFFNQHLFTLFLQFEGEIKVLYSTTTVKDLPQRRWGSKDLQVKPGECLEIIESTDDTKVLCRNEDGKCKF
uniref:FYN binding protein 1 n=1 Tax=Bubo bubo TaxID=30461 RepID=A0A8C0ES07_BUBBB